MLKKIILAAAMALVLTACSNSDSEPMTVPSSASTTTTVTTTTTAPKPVESTTTTTTTSVTTSAPEEDISTTTTTEAQTETTTTTTTVTTTAPTTTTKAPAPTVTFTATSKTVYATTYAPFRTTPADNGTVICYISPNAAATVTSVSSDNKWYGVTYNGMKGYALTSQTTTTAPKVTSTTTTTTTAKVTQPAKNKTALDLAFEALVIGNSTAQQRELIRQYVIGLVTSSPSWKANGCVLDESLYPFVDAQGNPCFDESVAVDWGNSSFTGQVNTSTYTAAYRSSRLSLDELTPILRKDFEDYGRTDWSGGRRYNLAFYHNKRSARAGYEIWNFMAMSP